MARVQNIALSGEKAQEKLIEKTTETSVVVNHCYNLVYLLLSVQEIHPEDKRGASSHSSSIEEMPLVGRAMVNPQ